jgi:soluble lytic murein transglycosylase-like protein
VFGGNAKLGATLVVVAAFAITTGVAGAQDRATGDLRSQASDLDADLRRQEAALDRKVGELTRVGSELEEAQAKADAAAARVQDLAKQTRNIGRDLESQKRAARKSRTRLEERLTAAYKGQELQGVVLLLEGLLGGSDGGNVLGDQAVRILTEDQESIQHYRENQRLLRNTVGQLGGRKAEYQAAREEQRARAEELARREAELEGSIGELRGEKGRTEGRLEELEGRIRELEAMKEAGLLDPPASGAAGESREEELRIAREEIVVEPVEELPLSGYRRLYKQAAEDYGFGPDWYVLMAVGKVESNHGENMGPSSAGAMGPMQFMPSTWETSGVDGNGDGVPNIMDPEDAIPAGAKYLADNGAPEDWHSALFAYNGAGWYVREVLEVAEQYRLLAGDDSVGPYGFEGPAPETTPAASYAPQPVPATPPPAEEIERPAREPKPAQEVQEQTAPERTTQYNSARTVSEYQY